MPCKAFSRINQRQCRSHAMRGMDVCRMHGGQSLRGPAHPKFRTGRYSKVLPTRILARYREAEQDADLTSLRSELALVDARLGDLFARVDTGESGALWRALLQAHRACKRYTETGHVAKMREALANVESRLDAGVRDHEAWREIQALIEQRRKLADSEARRLVMLQQMISAERLTVLMGVILDVITHHITDRRTLSAIATDLQRLAHVGDAAYGLPDAAPPHITSTRGTP